MKKLLIYLMVFAMIFSMAACTKGNDNNNVNTENNENDKDKIDAQQGNTDTEKDNASDNEVTMAPDFELEDLNGNIIKLSDYKGKKVIINFWATWCGFCVKEMPDFMKLKDAYKDDLEIIFVNVGESAEDVSKFLAKNNLSGNFVLDKNYAVSNEYGAVSLPSTLAVNEKGEAVNGHLGLMSYEQMVEFYNSIK